MSDSNKVATDDNGHRLTSEEIGMMTDQFNFNAFVAAEIARAESGPTHKFDVACRIQEASNYLRLNACKADRLALAEKEIEIQRLRGLCKDGATKIRIERKYFIEQGRYFPVPLQVLEDQLDRASKGSDK